MRRFYYLTTRNTLGMLGVALTTTSALFILLLVGIELITDHPGNPYLGIISFLILPGVLVMGLALIPIGFLLERRRVARGEAPKVLPVIDLNREQTRKLLVTFSLLSLVNIVILAAATYKGVEVMESTEFCGTTCHTVMQPEYTAYQGSPHARVKCVSCHIGPGADWFVKSKLSGAWQLVSVTFDLYQKPIPTPIHHLRPARETCEQCHWPTKFVGDRLWVRTHYDQDEANTELKTVLLLRVGGVEGRESHGIHWHVDPGIEIRYRADESRETIYDVEFTDRDGQVRTYYPGGDPGEGGDAQAEAAGEWRTMDCIDCHNRPTHIYRMPDTAIDDAIQVGRIPQDLPYIRREGLRLLREEHASTEAARRAITDGLGIFYRENYPEVASSRADDITASGGVLAEIFSRNVFPKMKVTWGTYPSHMGHTSFPGCFRCHDDEHATTAGEVISQDCSTCHTLLAMEEENPEVLQVLQP